MPSSSELVAGVLFDYVISRAKERAKRQIDTPPC